MATRRSLRLISLMLKVCTLFIFLFMVVGDTVNTISFHARAPFVDWFQFGYRVGGILVTGVMHMLFAYGGARAIDLLLTLERDVRAVGIMLKRQQPEPRENELSRARLPRLGIDPPPQPPVQDWQRKPVHKPHWRTTKTKG